MWAKEEMDTHELIALLSCCFFDWQVHCCFGCLSRSPTNKPPLTCKDLESQDISIPAFSRHAQGSSVYLGKGCQSQVMRILLFWLMIKSCVILRIKVETRCSLAGLISVVESFGFSICRQWFMMA